MIKSPLNYTGNKSRLLPQILPKFPQNINRFVDLCCGGCSVGINVSAKQIICIDNNARVIKLLKTLDSYSYTEIIERMESIITNFELSNSFEFGYEKYRTYIDGNNGLKNYNKEGFYKLRDYYNTHNFKNYREKSIHLYALLVFGFNNDLRFNRQGKYNLPIGKTDFNNNIRNKVKSFKDGLVDKNIHFQHSDMNIVIDLELSEDDFVYVDPPYLISTAVYNESNGWNALLEQELLKNLDFLNKSNIKFALSNVLRKKDAENQFLVTWLKENQFYIHDIEYHYRSSSYNKKNRNANEQEVLITNYEI